MASRLPVSSSQPSYLESKVLFVSNNFGASLARVEAVLLVSVASYALYASAVRLLHAQRRLREEPVSVQGPPWLRKITAICEKRFEDSACGLKILLLEFFITSVPFLLVVTGLGGSTYAVLSVVGTLLATSAYCYHQALYLASQNLARKTKDHRHEGNEESQGVIDPAVTYSQSSYAGQPLGAGLTSRRTRTTLTGKPTTYQLPSSPRRQIWDSDEEEQELEELERLEARRQEASRVTHPDKFSAGQQEEDVALASPSDLQVAVESAADQACRQAHAPETWSNSGFSPDDIRSLSPSSDTRRHRMSDLRGLGLGLKLGLVNKQTTLFDKSTQHPNGKARRDQDPFLVIYRAHMMLLTIICILAVDFPIFPRELGKCETWGFSLMDLGVGSFVFSLGVVSAAPYLTGPHISSRNNLEQNLRYDLLKSLPLFLLGLARVVTVKVTAYPEHLSEYGVHWSFFLTLAALPLLKTFVDVVRKRVGGRMSTWGLWIALAHQSALTWGGLQRFVLNEELERTASLWVANREGLVSLPGYLSILLLSIDLGMYILPRRDPYQAFRRVKLPQMPSHEETDDFGEDTTAGYSVTVSPPDATIMTSQHIRRASNGRIDIKASITATMHEQSKRLGNLLSVLVSWTIVYFALFAISSWLLASFAPFRGDFNYDSILTSTSSSLLASSLQRAREHGATMFTLAVSRRLANLPYILVVMALNIALLAALLAVYFSLLMDVKYAVPRVRADGVQAANSGSGRRTRAESETQSRLSVASAIIGSDSMVSSFALHDLPYPDETAQKAITMQRVRNEENILPMTPQLLHLINLHSLPLFLFANVLTGLINLSIPTMNISSSFLAITILLAYVAVNTALVTWLGEGKRGRTLRKYLRNG